MMDIQKNLTLQEKQKFWAEQLPNFESKYWLPSHFEFLAFDMDQGNYTIKDDLDPSFEDDATEIWHRVNTGWAMWKKAINFSKPHEGFVLVPKLSANYLFNKVPELGFKHQDEKDTVLYHLNYMASEFKESAKNFVVLDHEKQKRFVDESGREAYRSDFEIVKQTLELVNLLASSINVFQRDPRSTVYPFESKNPRVMEWWRTACKIQELLTDTDPENCDFEEYKAMIEAQEQSHD